MRLRWLAAAACAVLVSGCAGDSQVLTASAGDGDGVGEIGCGGSTPSFSIETITGPAPAESELFADEPGQALHAFLDNGGDPGGGGFIWRNGDWVVLDRADDRVTYGYRSDTGLATATADTTTGAWKVRGYGGCGPRYLGTSTWQTDGHLDRNASFILVNYDSGSSCYPPGDIVPVDHVDVTETGTEIGLAVFLKKDEPPPDWERPSGNFGCAGVGLTGQTRVELKGPVGDRVLLDYGAYPHAPPYA